MHTNRYLVHTLKNTPALIHYRLKALTRLVGRHSGRESGFDGLDCKTICSIHFRQQRFSHITVYCYATCHHAVRESLRGKTYREQSNSLYRVFHPLIKA